MAASRAARIVLLCAVAAPLYGELPEGRGRAETEELCQGCHDLAKSVSLRQDRNGWGATLVKMIGFGVKADDAQLEALLDYLSAHYGAEELPPVNVNTARAIQLESRLSLKRSEAAALLRYRSEHGAFQSFEDLLAVPGIDIAKLEAKRDRLSFE